MNRIEAGSPDAKPECGRSVYAFSDQYEDASLAFEVDDGDIAVFGEVVLGAPGANAAMVQGTSPSRLAVELLAIFAIDLTEFLELKELGRMKAECFRNYAFRQSHTRPAYQAFNISLSAGDTMLPLRLFVAHRTLLSRLDAIATPSSRQVNTSLPAFAPDTNLGISAKLQIQGYLLQDIVDLKPGHVIALNDARSRYRLTAGSQDLWSFALGEKNGQLAIQLEVRCARPT